MGGLGELNGKRGISKTQAKRLTELLHVPVDLFGERN